MGQLEERLVLVLDVAQVRGQGLAERSAVGVSEKLGQGLVGGLCLRQRVRLAVADHLDAVLDPAKVLVGCAELLAGGVRDSAGRGKRRQRVASADQAQRRVGAPPDQLVRLGEELDLANSAPAELEVLANLADLPAAVLRVDPPLGLVQFLHGGEVEAVTPHE